jgi:hypothetical protein
MTFSMRDFPALPLLALFGLAVAALAYQCVFRLACRLALSPAGWPLAGPGPAFPD